MIPVLLASLLLPSAPAEATGPLPDGSSWTLVCDWGYNPARSLLVYAGADPVQGVMAAAIMPPFPYGEPYLYCAVSRW